MLIENKYLVNDLNFTVDGSNKNMRFILSGFSNFLTKKVAVNENYSLIQIIDKLIKSEYIRYVMSKEFYLNLF